LCVNTEEEIFISHGISANFRIRRKIIIARDRPLRKMAVLGVGARKWRSLKTARDRAVRTQEIVDSELQMTANAITPSTYVCYHYYNAGPHCTKMHFAMKYLTLMCSFSIRPRTERTSANSAAFIK
jgi:hypothetical protein